MYKVTKTLKSKKNVQIIENESQNRIFGLKEKAASLLFKFFTAKK